MKTANIFLERTGNTVTQQKRARWPQPDARGISECAGGPGDGDGVGEGPGGKMSRCEVMAGKGCMGREELQIYFEDKIFNQISD